MCLVARGETVEGTAVEQYLQLLRVALRFDAVRAAYRDDGVYH